MPEEKHTDRDARSGASRSPISSIAEPQLDKIQRGTLVYEWKGLLCLKSPFDMALYQRLIWNVKPATIIEVGTYSGGGAVWLADISAAMGIPARVISIDVTPPEGLSHPMIEFRKGSSAELDQVLSDAEMQSLPRPLLVIEDSSHRYEHSIAVLRFFDRWLREGEYICIEDGIMDSFNVQERYNGGPNRALLEFLREAGDRFEVDRTYCDFYGYNVTWNTNGYLRRVGRGAGHALTRTGREQRSGTGNARIASLDVSVSARQVTSQFSTGDRLAFRMVMRAHLDLAGVVCRLSVTPSGGTGNSPDAVIVTTTVARNMKQWESAIIELEADLGVPAGSYELSALLADAAGAVLDERKGLYEIRVGAASTSS
jgi:cephalosporin hydroxylase